MKMQNDRVRKISTLANQHIITLTTKRGVIPRKYKIKKTWNYIH